MNYIIIEMANNPKFSIGDKVYHVTPDSPQGVVYDVLYSYRYNHYTYVITWAIGENTENVEDMLSSNKSLDI